MNISAWYAAGGPVMPLLTCCGLALWALLIERAYALFAPDTRRQRRHSEIAAMAQDADRAWLRRWLLVSEERELTRGLAAIRVLAAALPLVGLLGTVGGISALFGAGNAPEAARGVGEALIATQYALVLAVPALPLERLLRRRALRLAGQRSEILGGLP